MIFHLCFQVRALIGKRIKSPHFSTILVKVKDTKFIFRTKMDEILPEPETQRHSLSVYFRSQGLDFDIGEYPYDEKTNGNALCDVHSEGNLTRFQVPPDRNAIFRVSDTTLLVVLQNGDV